MRSPITRRLLAACAAAATLLALAGCGRSASGPGAGGVTWLPAPSGFEMARWDLQPGVSLHADTRQLPIAYVTGGCGAGSGAQRFDHAGIVESPSAVTITIYLRRAPVPTSVAGGPPVACPMLAVFVRRTITLPHPLGGRTLLDGSSTPPRTVQVLPAP